MTISEEQKSVEKRAETLKSSQLDHEEDSRSEPWRRRLESESAKGGGFRLKSVVERKRQKKLVNLHSWEQNWY